jgi:hypothetical protein
MDEIRKQRNDEGRENDEEKGGHRQGRGQNYVVEKQETIMHHTKKIYFEVEV